MLRLVVFREKHSPTADGSRHAHFHVAVQLAADRPQRFISFKRAFRDRHRVATHWSLSHSGYWSTVRYGYMPSPRKPKEELDPTPYMWAAHGTHPDLFEASQEPNTAAATYARRVKKVADASEAGRQESRCTELDLYAVIVKAGIRNSPDDPWAVKRLIAHLKEHATPALFQLAFRIRGRLSSLIDDVWAWETVGDDIVALSQSRWERLISATLSPCVCGGAWRRVAEWVLHANGLDAQALCRHIAASLYHGRNESMPVLVLMGKQGGEGKSFLLSPLRRIFGQEHVQEAPQAGNFPLLGLESKRIAILDDWDFSSNVLCLSTQLLWFEGKPFPITRPQNKEYDGHLMYKGSAPIFMTCKEKVLGKIEQEAHVEKAMGTASEKTMLMRRLCVFRLSVPLPLQSGTRIPECPACFAKLVVNGSSANSC